MNTEKLTPELKAKFEAIIKDNIPKGDERHKLNVWILDLMIQAYELERWVDVKDKRCPTMTGLLVWTGKEVGYRIFSKTHEEFSTDAFITRTGVTHWMPLPNPPTK